MPVLLLRGVYELILGDGFFDCKAEVVEVYGLGCKVERAAVHSLTDVAHIAVCAHHHAFEGGVAHFVDFSQKCESVHLRHIDVGEDDLDVGVFGQHHQRLQSVVSEEKFVLALADFAAEILRQQRLQIRLVIYA